ncbi:MAG: hypothetical protein GF344_02980 [Chitinivibrionales bacterium]|nr:hypothetical protein [Chitinivibrionales bacterium]MBD3356043.1 hypothetical protein [Chitinivibrionales bacterium]
MACRQYFAGRWARFHDEKRRMLGEMERVGIDTSAACCPFFLAHVEDATSFAEQMLQLHPIVIRDCTSFGMNNTIRIMPSLFAHNQKLLKALGMKEVG